MNRLAVLHLVLTTALLQGCIAAAIPLAAGAAIGRSQLERTKPSTKSASEPQQGIQVLSITELPPPDSVRLAESATSRAFESFTLGAVDSNPSSALLVDGASLSLTRRACAGLPLAVFIDLDPGRGTFDPLSPGAPDPVLARVLNGLREREVTVVWFSRLGDNFADAVRSALSSSGLDTAGTDRIVLMRDLEERKHSRRSDLARELCPVALLGDERADFDELFLYLKNPDAALPLEPMIGDGWFIGSPFESTAPGKEDEIRP